MWHTPLSITLSGHEPKHIKISLHVIIGAINQFRDNWKRQQENPCGTPLLLKNTEDEEEEKHRHLICYGWRYVKESKIGHVKH